MFLMFSNISMSQAIVDGNEVYYPYSHEIEYDQVIYKTAHQIDEIGFSITENLALRVFYPADLEAGEKRPLVVLIHGGGFISGTFAGFFEEAELLAQLGYVTVSVQYRLCKRTDCVVAEALTYPCNVSWGNSLVPSSYAAAVDVQDAIEWLVLHADDYHIDTDNIAVGGHSAGAITALNVAFMDQEDVNEICAGCGTWPDYLQGELESNPGIKAVFNMSGAIYDTLWIDEAESNINLMSIHGTADGVVAYGADPVYPCCNTYNTPVYGGCPISQRKNYLGGSHYLFTGSQFGHNVFDEEWRPLVREQIQWFLGKSFFSDDAFSKHTELIRSVPLETCPPPFEAVLPGELCQQGLSAPGTVIYGFPNRIEESDPTSEIKVFPNPAADFANLAFDEKLHLENNEITLNIFDSYGHSVKSIKFGNLPGEYQLDVSGLTAGVYFLSIQAQKHQIIEKITIIK